MKLFEVQATPKQAPPMGEERRFRTAQGGLGSCGVSAELKRLVIFR